jgi:predicted amidohydrolase
VRVNALEHAAVIRRARARVVIFPELSLTGYELDAPAISPDDEALGPIRVACAETSSVALVGAPVPDGAGLHIATMRLSGDGVAIAYLKSYLGGSETERFSAGTGPAALDIDGWRVGLGICKDTGVDQHIADTAALNVDLYAAGLVHRADELQMQEDRASKIARSCKAYVAFASFAGATGDGYAHTAGVSSIWTAEGTPLVRAGTEPGDVVTATLG